MLYPDKRTDLGRVRHVALLTHRYVGLVLTVFLFVAGATGSLLAFFHPLDAVVAPALHRVTPPTPGAKPLDPLVLRERIQAQLPASQSASEVDLAPKPDRSVALWIEVEPDKWRQAFFDPYTGQGLGSRDWGNLSDGLQNLMPFIYRLHYSLALGQVGTVLFGVIAILWTLDCFVGAYLTLPLPERRTRVVAKPVERARPWLRRWLLAWFLRANKLFSLVFTWHRASGLWLWGMLLVFAWSAVGLNLPEAYEPVMSTLTGKAKSGHALVPELKPPYPQPQLSWPEARERGRQLMAQEARARAFSIEREAMLYYANDHGVYSYSVRSSLDISEEQGRTEVYFDGQDGRLVAFDAPSGVNTGNTLSSWLLALHMATVGGVWYRVFVALMGVIVALLSVTGAWVWWRKRSKRVQQRSASVAVTHQARSRPQQPRAAAT